MVTHLHIRRQGHGNAADDIADGSRIGGGIKSIVLLRETPPGTLGTAAMLAVLVATVTLFLCVFRFGLNGAPAGPGGAVSLSTFLIAIPAFVAAALGRSIDRDRLARSSLVTYYGLFLVVMVSISVVFLHIIDSMVKLPTVVGERSVGFARLNFLRSADDRVKLKKVSERIRKERSGMTEEDIVEEYHRMKSLIIRHDQAT